MRRLLVAVGPLCACLLVLSPVAAAGDGTPDPGTRRSERAAGGVAAETAESVAPPASSGTAAGAAGGTVSETHETKPRAGLTGATVDPLHDVEGGPSGEGERFRQWTPLTEAERNAVNPRFREWVRLIDAGLADKRVMRLYAFYKPRLEPFDRPLPADWRTRGVRALRDDARSAAGIAAFEARAALSSEAEGGGRFAATAGTSGGALPGAVGGVSVRGVWVPIGPFTIAGRTTGLDRPADEPDTLYASTADGGVWRTRDRGATWERLSDFEATLSGGAILLDPTDANTIYFGTGEGNASGDNYAGVGVLKSTNAGLTWTASNHFSSEVRRLAMHEDEPTRIWAAGDAGCYVSTDAGATFSLVNTPGLPTGTRASDVVVRPDNPDWVYCAIWGGSQGGIYRSIDRGANWTMLSTGLPAAGSVGRIALAISRSSPATLVAGIDENAGTVYRTDDGGDTWTVPAGSALGYCGGQCWYDNVVGIDAQDPSVVYAGGVSAYKSTDGGVSWNLMSAGVHVDQHAIFTPSGGEVLLANDGGIYHSANQGGNWDEWSLGMDTTQYYGICRNPTDDYWAFGGTQDNGSHRRRLSDGWAQVLGGDGGMCMHGPDGSNVVVGEYQNTNIQRSSNGGASWAGAHASINWAEPHPWVGVLVADPSNRLNMWTGTSRIYRSLDARASNWSAVSGPLYFGQAVSAIEVAPSDSNVVYVGFNGTFFQPTGLYKSVDALVSSPTWNDIADAVLPKRSVRRIRVHPDFADTVYVVFSGTGSGKIWKSIDGGTSWTDHTGDLPDLPVNDLLVDADNPGTLLAATDLGVFRSDDDGTTWYGFGSGLPTSAAIEFTYNRTSGVLRIGTHGRSIWEWQPASTLPTAVPDGVAVGGDQLRVAKLSPDTMRVYWDAVACTAQRYNLFYGDFDDVATRTYSGAECDLGNSGQADIPFPVTPSGSAFFILAAADAAGTEGPHAFDDAGQPLPSNGIGFCGITNQDALATCP